MSIMSRDKTGNLAMPQAREIKALVEVTDM
jgi:hypothetical protein